MARVAAEVSNASELGSLARVLMPAARLREEIARTRERTDRPFAVNHILNQFDPEAWEATQEARPTVISFALGDPGEHVAQAHAAGSHLMR